MKHRMLTFAVSLTLAASAEAQQPANDPLSSYLRRSFAAVSRDLAAVVETMPQKSAPAGAPPPMPPTLEIGMGPLKS